VEEERKLDRWEEDERLTFALEARSLGGKARSSSMTQLSTSLNVRV
jgi:hypothetical protein